MEQFLFRFIVVSVNTFFLLHGCAIETAEHSSMPTLSFLPRSQHLFCIFACICMYRHFPDHSDGHSCFAWCPSTGRSTSLDHLHQVDVCEHTVFFSTCSFVLYHPPSHVHHRNINNNNGNIIIILVGCQPSGRGIFCWEDVIGNFE